MRSTVATTCLLALTLSAAAAEKTKPNTVTPKEAADGWLSLFDGATTFGWKIDGEAKVENGELILGGKHATVAETTTEFPSNNYQTSFEYFMEGGKGTLRLHFGNHVEECDVSRSASSVKWEKSGASGKVAIGAVAQPARLCLSIAEGGPVHIRSLKLRLRNAENDDFVSLFNGKDLTGWKIYPGQQAEFTVTPEGWLNASAAKGDIQTEGQWADFAFHCECISNGKHLNSGIFFRAQPGKMWQGYEAQIRNQFTEKPTQEYTIEEYDPTTHELKGKHKEKYTAVDYGTGAIYRRVPARKEIAKDGEWFTMTIIARGRHLATWVNGFQEVDFTDNRPTTDNARNGCCLNRGVISIQAHDRTTNLSFRNIRLVETPPAK